VKPDVRTLIAHCHAPARAGVRESLRGHGFAIVAEAVTASSAVELALRERPDLCLLDIGMPGDGTCATAEITAQLPETAVVIMSPSSGDVELFGALRAGARGYLLMDTDPGRLPHILRGVLAGEAAMPRRLVARLITEFRSHGPRRRLRSRGHHGAELTWREWEVLELLHEGLSTREAAERLLVSPVTVRRHISAIVRKLGVRDRRAAASLLAEVR
jgi:DNA-binding NarL/FixJ family response regulator